MNADEIVRALKWLARETEFKFAAEQLTDAAALIESLQAQLAAKDAEIERLREAQRWIPVTEGLPKTNKPVQVYMPKLYMSVQTGFYDRYYGEDDGEWHEHWVAPGEVTHWKELPAAPEETKGETENG